MDGPRPVLRHRFSGRGNPDLFLGATLKTINAFELKNRIAALLLEFPELVEDEDLRLDTLEGETDFNEVMAIIVDDITKDEAMVAGIEMKIKEWQSRKDRFEFRARGRRKLAKELMDNASLRKLILPLATLSIRSGQPSVVITDQSFLPTEFWRIKRVHHKKRHLATIPMPEKPKPIKLQQQGGPFLGLTLLQLQKHHCRWPEGGEGNGPILFCGQPKADGSPYCLHHHSLVYYWPRFYASSGQSL